MGLSLLPVALGLAIFSSLPVFLLASIETRPDFQRRVAANDLWQLNSRSGNGLRGQRDPFQATKRNTTKATSVTSGQMLERITSLTCLAQPVVTMLSLGQSVKLKSPKYPRNYPKNQYCGWYLASEDPNVRFRIKCKVFRLQSPKKKQCYDYLSINEKFYCGRVFPRKWYSTTNQETVVFKSDHKKQSKGFVCKVSAISAAAIDPTDCSPNPLVNTLPLGSSITVTTPRYPVKYPKNENCGWYVQGEDWSVRLNVTCPDFLLQGAGGQQCNLDYFSLNQERYCGSNGPSKWISSSSQATLWFSSNKKVRRRGFSCSVTGVGPSSYGIGASTNCKCGRVNRATRIIGGEATEVNEYPWQVALVHRDTNKIFCGGSIINNRWILTSAHCVVSVPTFKIVVGGHSWTNLPPTYRLLEIQTYFYHPNYNSFTQDNDLLLVQLAETLDFGDPSVAPICPPEPYNDYIGVNATATGWGYTENDSQTLPSELQEVDVTTISTTKCAELYTEYTITNNMLCAGHPEGGKDSCQGDSGGPLVKQEGDHYIQIGVISWGEGCGVAGFPGVYATIANQMDWINSIASSGETCPK